MYCIIPLVLGFVAGRTCGYGGGCGGGYSYSCGYRRCCRF